jgi:thiol-disulfide isomerase/thioredoxin
VLSVRQGKPRPTLTRGGSADVTRKSKGVRVEILAREDCPNRDMAVIVVERVVDETGVPAEIEVVDVLDDEEAAEYRVLGSPTVLVDGRDVDPEPMYDVFSADDRLYRTPRGPSGWPEAEWIRDALLRAVAQTTSNGRQ